MAGKETGLETTDDPWGTKARTSFCRGVGERDSGERGVFELELEGSTGKGKFSTWKEHSEQREQCEPRLSQGRLRRCACSWEEELLLDDLDSWPWVARDLPKVCVVAAAPHL